jgi:hypothetical protein
VISAQFGDQVGRVLSRVDGQGLGDDQQSLRKFSNSELLSGNRKDRVKLQISPKFKTFEHDSMIQKVYLKYVLFIFPLTFEIQQEEIKNQRCGKFLSD